MVFVILKPCGNAFFLLAFLVQVHESCIKFAVDSHRNSRSSPHAGRRKRMGETGSTLCWWQWPTSALVAQPTLNVHRVAVNVECPDRLLTNWPAPIVASAPGRCTRPSEPCPQRPENVPFPPWLHSRTSCIVKQARNVVRHLTVNLF